MHITAMDACNSLQAVELWYILNQKFLINGVLSLNLNAINV